MQTFLVSAIILTAWTLAAIHIAVGVPGFVDTFFQEIQNHIR